MFGRARCGPTASRAHELVRRGRGPSRSLAAACKAVRHRPAGAWTLGEARSDALGSLAPARISLRRARVLEATIELVGEDVLCRSLGGTPAELRMVGTKVQPLLMDWAER